MHLRGIGTAAVALALVGSAPASAETWRVQEGGGACDTDTTCGSIAAAADEADTGDVIEITPRPGGWPATPAVELDQQRITVRGVESGEVRVNGTLTFTGSGTEPQSLGIERLSIFAPSGGNALRVVSGTVSADKTVSIQGSILSGNGANAALYASTEISLNAIAVTASHVTIADKDGAPRVDEDENDEVIDVTFVNSLLPAVAEHGSLFAAPSAEDFHLRVGSTAIGDGGTGAGGEIAKDVDGEDRDSAWDRGGDEFVNHAPAKPSLSASPARIFEGESVAFTVTGATDPDGALQDDVVTYLWDFGDGVVEPRTPGDSAHAYAADGTCQARVTAVDKTGTAGPPSDPVTIVVDDPPPPPPPGGGGGGGGLTSLTQLPGFEAGIAPGRRGPDADPPYVAFSFPRARQVVRVRRRAPVLRGRNADVSGVRRVELSLMRREGARCRWYDGRRAFRLGGCGNPVWFKVVLDDFSWRYRFPRRVRPRPGRYVALVRAFDYLGNLTSAFGPANAISFRIAR